MPPEAFLLGGLAHLLLSDPAASVIWPGVLMGGGGLGLEATEPRLA